MSVEKAEKNSKLAAEIEALKTQITSLSSAVTSNKSKEAIFKASVEKLEKGEVLTTERARYLLTNTPPPPQQELLKSLKCCHCSKFIKEPVTVIPCGHSFCLGCKKAYASKECIKCGPKIKVEAMYRNELLDDIIEMYKTLGEVKETLQTMIKAAAVVAS